MAATLPPFNSLVAEAIISESHISRDQLIILDNSAKYCPGAVQTSNDSLSAIFGTMANLNKAALETIDL